MCRKALDRELIRGLCEKQECKNKNKQKRENDYMKVRTETWKSTLCKGNGTMDMLRTDSQVDRTRLLSLSIRRAKY